MSCYFHPMTSVTAVHVGWAGWCWRFWDSVLPKLFSHLPWKNEKTVELGFINFPVLSLNDGVRTMGARETGLRRTHFFTSFEMTVHRPGDFVA